MGTMITVSVSSEHGVQQFFNTQGMEHYCGFEKIQFLIEVCEKPLIFTRLEEAGYFSENDNHVWNLTNITDKGLTIYLCHKVAGDGYVFIPMSNILSIHTVTENWIASLRENLIS